MKDLKRSSWGSVETFFYYLVILAFLTFSFLYTKQWVKSHWLSSQDVAFNHATRPEKSLPNYEIIETDLEVPWDIAFLPSGEILVTERLGRLVRIGKSSQTILINQPFSYGEGGLHGITLHPDFKRNHWIYLYRTIKKDQGVVNRVERYRLDDNGLKDKNIIVDDIPGAVYHDGGRIAFGPDGYLYIATGDANQENLAQDIHSLAGKILRLADDGTIPLDNPFGNAVYSYGHRNPQGLTWDSSKRLWSTEHGPSGLQAGEDELNLIEKGQNYGWPIITGWQTKPNMKTPIMQSGKEVTWAPASALYWDGSVFFGGLRGEALYEAHIDRTPVEIEEHFKEQFGRIRTVVLGPDGYFYLTTSNLDGRGSPQIGDDKIIKINPRIFRRSKK